MPADLAYLWLPFLACLVLTGIHSYLGVHVIERGVIFVDLALAQIAALGATVALLVGDFPIGSPQAYWLSLGFTLVGAAVFAATRIRESRIPQEAVIGIVYAVASAAAIVVVAEAHDPHGAEHIKDLMAGNILFVTKGQILKTAAIYAAVGAFHFVFRRPFLEISMDPAAAAAKGRNLALWDFLFYGTFGFVITSSVQIAGVLLVFSFLIVPAVFAVLFARTLAARLAIGWTLGTVVSFVGLLVSWDRPSGPVIVTVFGLALLAAGLARYVWLAERRGAALFRIGAGAGAIAAIVGAAALLKPADAKPHVHREAPGPAEANVSPEEMRAAEDLLDDETLLLSLEAAESDSDRLRYAAVLHRRGRPEGRAALEELAASAAPEIRARARHLLE